MSQSITCNFARAAIRHYMQQKKSKGKKTLPLGAMTEVYECFQEQFSSSPSLTIDGKVAAVKFPLVEKIFSRKCNPAKYMETFSPSAWSKLTKEDQEKHSLVCTECKRKFKELDNSFPCWKPRSQKKHKKPVKIFAHPSLTPKEFLYNATDELENVCQKNFNLSLKEVISCTPTSKLQNKLTSAEKQQAKRRLLSDFKNEMESKLSDTSLDVVLGNRTSWKGYDRTRHIESLEKRDESQPIKKRKHGASAATVEALVDTEELISEASGWGRNQLIIWDQLGAKYGLTGQNRGQTLRQYLEEKGINIPTATQTKRRRRRAKKKFKGGRVSLPTRKPAKKVRAQLKQKIASGDIDIGDEILPSQLNYFKVDKKTQDIVCSTATISSRKISLDKIRRKLLKKHEDLGLVRQNTNDELMNMTHEQLVNLLSLARESVSDETPENTIRQKIHQLQSTRYLKVWHDHSTMAGHGYFLVTISCIYDPAFYFTRQELEEKGCHTDVESVVEEPEVYIISRRSKRVHQT